MTDEGGRRGCRPVLGGVSLAAGIRRRACGDRSQASLPVLYLYHSGVPQ